MIKPKLYIHGSYIGNTGYNHDELGIIYAYK